MSRLLKPRIAIFDFYDQDLRRDVGRDVAVLLAKQLSASVHYQVVERNDWHRLLGGVEINQNCRLHPAWAMQIGNWVSADAVVVGRVGESDGGEMTIATTMFNATGVVLAHASDSTVETLSAKLSCSSLVNTIRIRSRPLSGRVTVGSNTLASEPKTLGVIGTMVTSACRYHLVVREKRQAAGERSGLPSERCY